LQVVDCGRLFAGDGMSQFCSTFGAGPRSLAVRTSAFTDPEPIIAARVELEAAETITKPETMATEAVLRSSSLFLLTRVVGPDYLVLFKTHQFIWLQRCSL